MAEQSFNLYTDPECTIDLVFDDVSGTIARLTFVNTSNRNYKLNAEVHSTGHTFTHVFQKADSGDVAIPRGRGNKLDAFLSLNSEGQNRLDGIDWNVDQL